MTQEFVVSVSSLVSRIKTVLTQNLNIEHVWISGEVSNLVKHRSGHYYFSLKDGSGEISCVMFSSYVHKLSFTLEEGMKVLTQGSVSIFEQRGSLQFYVKQMKPDGIGDLYLELEKRKQRLLEQGYFQESHKKDKPEWIENIGIITAKEGAALQDVLKTIRIRWPMMKMTLYPAYVQGTRAADSIIHSLLKADTMHHDALLLVRGGGSFEDLFCFNDENLVKTIYHLNTYIVSGIGHEVDTTLCDYVSDHRSLTPTAAAQWVSPDYKQVQSTIDYYKKSMIQTIQNRLQMNQKTLQTYKNHPYIQDPMSFVFDKSLKLDHYMDNFENIFTKYKFQHESIEHKQAALYQAIQSKQKEINAYYQSIDLESSIHQYLNRQNEIFGKKILLLDAYSPLKILDRGYSIAQKDGKIIRSIDDVNKDDIISVRLRDGMIEAQIKNKENHNG